MSKKSKLHLWHKKSGTGASSNAMAIHGSIKGGRLVESAQKKLTRSQKFLLSLKQEIRKAAS